MSELRDGRTSEARWHLPVAIALAIALLPSVPSAAQAKHGPAPVVAPVQPNAAPAPSPEDQTTLDRMVAIVNGDLILESDVEAEDRFAAFQPFSEAKPISREQLIERLIDRALILQQMALQPEQPITDAEVDAQLVTLRKSIPKCAAYHCETDAGWEKFTADHGFTTEEIRDRWKERMEVLQFIEERFRMGTRILPEEIDDYYKNTMLPAYQKEKVTPPAEATLADRIQEILLQQRVNKLLDDWLTALRAQGTVSILKPGEEKP
jgi:peptidyl-prolyl cis-trans isomerase SurA